MILPTASNTAQRRDETTIYNRKNRECIKGTRAENGDDFLSGMWRPRELTNDQTSHREMYTLTMAEHRAQLERQIYLLHRQERVNIGRISLNYNIIVKILFTVNLYALTGQTLPFCLMINTAKMVMVQTWIFTVFVTIKGSIKSW